MALHFHATISSQDAGITTLTVGFGVPASNAEVVPDAVASISALNLTGGRGIHLNGPMSIPAAFATAHAIGHLFGYVACFDPKLEQYVVAISHDPDFTPGQLIKPAIRE